MHHLCVVLVTVPVLDLAGFIGLRGNSLSPSKIDDLLSELSNQVHEYWSDNFSFSYIQYAAWHGASFGVLRFSISLKFSK